ncbi:unnamed protein product [Rotaria sp. Silwood1]|nr:unnamed protein product [Rotaria sp. Silwood1]CAF1672783.1 unnamed protein product [Rotaria sp. Silwood1]CAF3899752.1 unnamed protein product [Rotaria sp. Silwood1]CAF3921512.1 unnamed protein product [Rotaria sp. Silwood1]CAF4968026.1 unnamed protein product [Rotaria sp. Silwood1]
MRNKVVYFNIFNDVNPSVNIYCLKDLQTLQLINTNLPILPDIKNFQNLTSLTIRSDNGAIGRHLPSEFGQLKYLSTLQLSNIQNLEDLPDDIEYFVRLSSLTLENIPNLSRIPDKSIGKLTELKTLNLTDLPNLTTIPSTINNFEQLSTFEITKTSIKRLNLEKINSLSDLIITFNSLLQTIEITNMASLSFIKVQNNSELSTVNIQNLYYLGRLHILSNTKLISVNIANVSNGDILSIANNPQLITVTLKNISGLRTFETNSLFNLKSISFDNIPYLYNVSIRSTSYLETVSFIKVPSMRYLDLSGCQLTTFPESILKLKSLINLIMVSNQLSTLPSTLSSDLPNLKVFNLANNNFQGNMFQPALFYIRELYLSNNLLTSIYGIQEYKSLNRLELDYNHIGLIPLEIMHLSTTLEILTINYNKLNHIPYQITNMRSLRSFSATNNPISIYEQQNILKIFSQSPIKFRI